jgi:hypothetical protein
LAYFNVTTWYSPGEAEENHQNTNGKNTLFFVTNITAKLVAWQSI